MDRKITVLVLLLCFIATNASAHIMNRDNVYADLSLTEAADEIVLLAALHVIQPKAQQFEPTAMLTMAQLAKWVAGYYGLADEQAAVEAGFIHTLEGNATYEAVNAAYFNNALPLQQTGALTREAFAQFVAAHVNNAMNGQTMIEAASFTAGPTGVIEAFQQIDGKNVLMINGTAYTLGDHPSVIAHTIEPTAWVGQTISESYIGPNREQDYVKASDQTALQFIVLGQERYTVQPFTEAITMVAQAEQHVETFEEVVGKEHTTNVSITWIYGLLIVVTVMGMMFMWKRRNVR